MKKFLSVSLLALAASGAIAVAQPSRPWPGPYLSGAGAYRENDCLTVNANGAIIDPFSGPCAMAGSYLPLSGGTLTGTLTFADGGMWGSTGPSTTSAASFGNVNVTSSTVPTNGIFLSGANILGIATNGTSKWTISSAGAISNVNTNGAQIAAGAPVGSPAFIPFRSGPGSTTGFGASAQGLATIYVQGAATLDVSTTTATISMTTASTSTTTGALVVAGGVGVAGNVFANTFTAATTGQISWSGRAILTSPTAAGTQFGAADAAAPVAQTVSFQSVVAGTTNTAGVNTAIDLSRGTGTGIGGNYTINYAPHSTTGNTQNNLVAGWTLNGDTGAQTFATALYASCTALTTNASGVLGCTASDKSLKNPQGAIVDASTVLARIPAAQVFSWKDSKEFDAKQHIGLYAQDVCKADSRLCADRPFKGGRRYNYEDRGVLALLVKAEQEHTAKIAQLEKQVTNANRVIQHLMQHQH